MNKLTMYPFFSTYTCFFTDYDPKTSSFVKLHQEIYGKSGARSIVPGQYLATGPKGRSMMIATMEKEKLVHILNRDAAANLTISFPLEAHKNAAIIHHIVSLDIGFQNPMFAALEVEYTDSDQDPSAEAFNKAKKVWRFSLFNSYLTNHQFDVSTDAYYLL